MAELSEFYFSEKIAVRMNSVIDRSLKLLALNDEWKEAKDIELSTAKPLVQPRHDLMREIRDDCFKITDDMKGVLRVGNA